MMRKCTSIQLHWLIFARGIFQELVVSVKEHVRVFDRIVSGVIICICIVIIISAVAVIEVEIIRIIYDMIHIVIP